mmetsp:Transcript_8770/g.20825  ORF Transcript_8770/g.20825 Transcript_8770/m.20825 type:complete len:286 (-) Transcript_8770:85-942(-)
MSRPQRCTSFRGGWTPPGQPPAEGRSYGHAAGTLPRGTGRLLLCGLAGAACSAASYLLPAFVPAGAPAALAPNARPSSARALLVARHARGRQPDDSARPDLRAIKHRKRQKFHRGGINMPTTDFALPSEPRGFTDRGKKNHFHLLDRYIRRIDSLVPEDMENLVKPLSHKPNQERTTRTLKITFDVEPTTTANVTEEDVRAFLRPLAPSGIALGWEGTEGESEVYVQFDTNDECQSGRRLDGEMLGQWPAKVRYSVDNKFRRVCEDLGLIEPRESLEAQFYHQER